jgi:hypothetical protein
MDTPTPIITDLHLLWSEHFYQRMLLELIEHAELATGGNVSEEVAALKTEIQARVDEGRRQLPRNAWTDAKAERPELVRALVFTWDLPVERHMENLQKIREQNAKHLLALMQLGLQNLHHTPAYIQIRASAIYAFCCFELTEEMLTARMRAEMGEAPPFPTQAFFATMLPRVCRTEFASRLTDDVRAISPNVW